MLCCLCFLFSAATSDVRITPRAPVRGTSYRHRFPLAYFQQITVERKKKKKTKEKTKGRATNSPLSLHQPPSPPLLLSSSPSLWTRRARQPAPTCILQVASGCARLHLSICVITAHLFSLSLFFSCPPTCPPFLHHGSSPDPKAKANFIPLPPPWPHLRILSGSDEVVPLLRMQRSSDRLLCPVVLFPLVIIRFSFGSAVVLAFLKKEAPPCSLGPGPGPGPRPGKFSPSNVC
jgi:hypothetical protein